MREETATYQKTALPRREIRHVVRREGSFDAQRVRRVDQDACVVAEDLAERFVHLPRVALGPDRISKLGL